MKIVTLDGGTLPVPPPQPTWCSDWQFRHDTAEDEIVMALKGATIAITNKVPCGQQRWQRCLSYATSV